MSGDQLVDMGRGSKEGGGEREGRGEKGEGGRRGGGLTLLARSSSSSPQER